MKSSVKRVLTGVIALPALLLIVLFLPYFNYIAFALITFFCCFVGSFEMKRMISPKDNLLLPFWIGSLLPIAYYIEYAFFPDYHLSLYTLVGLCSLVLIVEMLTGGKDDFKNSIDRIAKSITNIVYPNLFGMFFIRFGFLENTVIWLLTFLLFVFSSDTFAYLFGIMFGKNNKGIVKVSPNKSLAGFIAGALVPAIEGALLCHFIAGYQISWYLGFILGLCTAIAGTLGDLVESTFKRSAGIKDSGVIVPGRGGIMDSIDSLLMAAPIYIFIIHYINVL